jgi:hypothetical protein
MSNTIQCPQCSHQFEMTEALLKQVSQQAQAEIEERLKVEREKITREADEKLAAAAEDSARQRHEAEESARRLREEAVAAAVRLEKESQAQEETLRAQREQMQQASLERLMTQITQLQSEKEALAERQRLAEITARQQADAAATQRITAVTAEIEQRLAQQAELRVNELNLQLGTLREQLAQANNRAQQASQQNIGAALEASVEEQLRAAFPRDIISDVPAGVNGADVMLDVVNDQGFVCGRILFELKRTQAWSNDWPNKLTEDMHPAKADLGVIITQTMPRDLKGAGLKDGVWVSDFTSAMPLIRSLRWGLQEAHLQKRIADQSGEASAVLFDFVTSGDFRNRVQTIMKTYASMQDALAKEKRAMQKMWQVREAHLEALTKHTSHVITKIEVTSGHQIEDLDAILLEDGSEGDDIIDGDEGAPALMPPLDGDELGQLGEIFLAKLRNLGGSAGNKAMRFELIWDAEKFERVKKYLIDEELIIPGRGRGGSVSLAGGVVPQGEENL